MRGPILVFSAVFLATAVAAIPADTKLPENELDSYAAFKNLAKEDAATKARKMAEADFARKVYRILVVGRRPAKSIRQFVSQSVEKKVVLKDFSLVEGFGAYCVLTDASLTGKKAKPGDYKVMGSGQIQPNENMLGVVSLFADDAAGKEFTAMINIINSLKVTARDAR